MPLSNYIDQIHSGLSHISNELGLPSQNPNISKTRSKFSLFEIYGVRSDWSYALQVIRLINCIIYKWFDAFGFYILLLLLLWKQREREKTTPDYKAITSQLDHLMVPSPIKERTLMFDFNFFKIVGSIMRFRSGAIYFHMGRWAQRSKFQLAWEKSSWISCKISLEWTTDEGERERARAQKVAA